MDNTAKLELAQTIVKVQESLLQIAEIRERGDFAELTGLYEMLAAVAQNSLSTAVLVLNVITRLDHAKVGDGEPVVVGTQAAAPQATSSDPKLTDEITSEDKEPCEDCVEYADPAPGVPIRLCPTCGRKLARNRR
jgi:hypothetical protein